MVTPRLTVLMPVFNAERFLREAMDSILCQTFYEFEFLIIDDGSTDNSLSIIRSYTDRRIRLYLNDQNIGISATLNKGLLLANSGLIARMDADDVSDPTRLQKQYDYMLAHPDCALLSTWATVVDESNNFEKLERYRSAYYYYNLTFECWIYHPTVMFRKAAVQAVGSYSQRYSEDYDLFWKLSTRYEIGNLAESLLNYRLSSSSLNMVTRRIEYDIANEHNVLRNIRFYMGNDFDVSKPCLECLRHNFEPIIKSGSIDDALTSLRILDLITARILARENVNRDPQAIREAHGYKREFIIKRLAGRLPLLKKLDLITRTHAWMLAWSLAINFMKYQIRKVKSFLLSF
jgi:glycosyltransferase involved in cell wall biosynthesis